MTRFGLIRDIVLLVNGLGLIWFEAIFEHIDRPWLITAGISLALGVVFLPNGVADGFSVSVKRSDKKSEKEDE